MQTIMKQNKEKVYNISVDDICEMVKKTIAALKEEDVKDIAGFADEPNEDETEEIPSDENLENSEVPTEETTLTENILRQICKEQAKKSVANLYPKDIWTKKYKKSKKK